jgi:hypothetical protein
MHNGDSGYNNGGSSSSSSSQYRSRNTYATSGNLRVAGFEIKPLYLYIGAGIIFLVILYFLVNILRAAGVLHFGLVSGVLLLLANVRELIGRSYGQHKNTALLNCLIGGGLLSAWLGEIVGLVFWLPAIALLVISIPLAVGRASVYSAYMNTARAAMGNLRRAAGRAASRWN